MAAHPEPTLDDHLWTIAAARLLLPADVSVQAPPNLAYDDFPRLLDAGIDDWGGVSPVTIDHVNPEAPWPELDRLAAATRSRGLELAPRLPVYPRYLSARVGRPGACCRRRCARADALGLAREDGWHPGETRRRSRSSSARDALPVGHGRDELGEEELVRLFRARGDERQRVFAAADRLRREVCGDEVTLRRHAEHPVHERLLLPLRLLRLLEGQARGEPARRAVPRPARRDRPPRARGVGARRDRGLPPGRDPPGVHRRLLRVVVEAIRTRAARPARPRVLGARGLAGRGDARPARSRTTSRGCATLGLGSLPGTAAEILDDEVRAIICPDKVDDRAVARGARGRAPRRPALERDDHVRPRRAAAALGAAPAAGARAAASGRAASPSSCRCRSCTWRRRSGCRAARGRGRPSARRCSCTPSRGSRSIPRSRTSRRRG